MKISTYLDEIETTEGGGLCPSIETKGPHHIPYSILKTNINIVPMSSLKKGKKIIKFSKKGFFPGTETLTYSK